MEQVFAKGHNGPISMLTQKRLYTVVEFITETNNKNTLKLAQIVQPSLQGFFFFSNCQDCYIL